VQSCGWAPGAWLGKIMLHPRQRMTQAMIWVRYSAFSLQLGYTIVHTLGAWRLQLGARAGRQAIAAEGLWPGHGLSRFRQILAFPTGAWVSLACRMLMP
jgi:hypothetical protein